jgi:hypothetical protein
MSYAAVANEVRHFTTRFWGPTLDVMSSSIELMRLEGLVEADGTAATAGEAVLHLTQTGRTELHELLSATVRVPASDFNKLVVALKLRFMHLLPIEQQRAGWTGKSATSRMTSPGWRNSAPTSTTAEPALAS